MGLSGWFARRQAVQLGRDLAMFRKAYALYTSTLADEEIDTERYEAHLATFPPAALAALEQFMGATDDLHILLDPAPDVSAVTSTLAKLAPLVGLSPTDSPVLVLGALTELVTDATPGLWERF